MGLAVAVVVEVVVVVVEVVVVVVEVVVDGPGVDVDVVQLLKVLNLDIEVEDVVVDAVVVQSYVYVVKNPSGCMSSSDAVPRCRAGQFSQ